ncbi:MAG: DUF357 domain-containing protein [Methanophagales archaeon]|nr:DUF357 domain-containing protein [Methanophagales archaeon]MCW7073738.1 DUF357 domain-containing protein [Methanophagales archaeon]
MRMKEGEEERIKKDIALFEESITELGEGDWEVLELARAYCEDARYYLAKGDYLTAFGCINYAHGLIDGIKGVIEFVRRQQSQPR